MFQNDTKLNVEEEKVTLSVGRISSVKSRTFRNGRFLRTLSALRIWLEKGVARHAMGTAQRTPLFRNLRASNAVEGGGREVGRRGKGSNLRDACNTPFAEENEGLNDFSSESISR